MILKKDIVLICIIGLFLMGVCYSGNLLDGIQTIYKGIIVSGNEFWSIIVTISLIVTMSNALNDIGADVFMVKPFKRLVKNPSIAFWLIGILMMLFSFVLWPSPAVALIGAIILPVAVKAGLPPIWAAAAMNLFGHGAALSGDFFIQGAPAITAKAANIENSSLLMKAGLPLWFTMSVVTVTTSYLMMLKDLKKYESTSNDVFEEKELEKDDIRVKIIAILTPITFIVDIFIMYSYKLKGGDAAALLTGTAIFITTICVIIKDNIKNVLSELGIYMKNGFIFGIETFAPILIVGAFFFLGSQETASQILGEGASGYLADLGMYLSTKITLSKPLAIIVQTITAGISGLGGAGFSALPLVGTIAGTLSKVVKIDTASLASLGQISAMWIGGGTLIPWGVIAVAAICKVNPIELVRKNFIPVIAGLFVTMVVANFLM
ncbi:hypothetical protein [Anaerosacchariphilus polymeriproducens]|nr:hypothetical protein [Anaerosacchariphilus polymeriproducens]